MNGNQSYESHEHFTSKFSRYRVRHTFTRFIVFFRRHGKRHRHYNRAQKRRQCTQPQNYLLMNLAVADLLTLLLCPGVYDFALNHFRINSAMGDMVCKLFVGNAIVCITFDASVLTLCVIALERYVAIVKPFKSSSWNITSKKTGNSHYLYLGSGDHPDLTRYFMDGVQEGSHTWFISVSLPATMDPRSRVNSEDLHHYSLRHSYRASVNFDLIFVIFSVLKVLKWDLSDPVIDEADKSNMRRLLKLLVSLAVAFLYTLSPIRLLLSVRCRT